MYAASHPKVAPEIRRRYIEEQQKGKVVTRQDYYEKIRYRQHETEQVEAIVVDHDQKQDETSKGLDYYLEQRKKGSADTKLEPE